MQRIPGLDGLRAISILLVLCGHLEGTRGFYNNPVLWNHLGDVANLGVRVFFVISGYLITLLLLREAEQTGTISIRQFYLRRTLRIFPASYCFLLAVTAASFLGIVQLHRGDLLHAYTYTVNYFPERFWSIAHLWSLSVEEQFYLLWPAALLVLGTRNGLRVAMLCVVVVPLVRLATDHFWIAQQATLGNSFQTVSDTIATGCLLAGYKDHLLRLGWFNRFMTSPLFFLAPLAALALNLKGGGRFRWLVLETVINTLIALCVCRATLHTKDRTGKVLNWPPLVFVGILSYSLYLWQQLFLNRNSSAWFASFPQNLVFAFAAALFCHYCIERPFLKLRDARPSNRVFPAVVPAAGERQNFASDLPFPNNASAGVSAIHKRSADASSLDLAEKHVGVVD